ncbi:MAG TPA: SDR family NAD(P)-dependent oxidoreductase [Terriglobia bacterium]|nr:SDR family NAD(P)-dependent oxidoreductase [Terriglobia bacterium]
MDLKGRRVLVTGAGGFIGSHLAERLVELGAQTRALVHYRSNGSWGWLDSSPRKADIEIIAGDVCDRDCVVKAMRKTDAVFHLAALIGIPYSYDAPAAYVATNINGTLNVLQAARESNVERLVHTSTSEVYGTARRVPIDEQHPLQGQSPYSASKIGADKLAESFFLSFALPVVTIRPFNAFGPRQSARAVIPTIISQCLAGEVVKLGSLHPTRDFNYVGNTVDGFIRCAESKEAVGQTINIGSGNEVSIEDVARRIIKIVGKSVEIRQEQKRSRPETSEVERLIADNSMAMKLLGWKPRICLDEGLRLTIDWIRDHLDEYRPGTYSV